MISLHVASSDRARDSEDPTRCIVRRRGVDAPAGRDALGRPGARVLQGRLLQRLPDRRPSTSAAPPQARHPQRATLVTRACCSTSRARGVDPARAGLRHHPARTSTRPRSVAGVRLEPRRRRPDPYRTHAGCCKEPARRTTRCGDSPGPGMAACAEWFHERDLAAVATDTIAFEVWPAERRRPAPAAAPAGPRRDGDDAGTELRPRGSAPDDCAADGAYDFLLEASPEPFERGLGSPVNPVAIK